MSDTAQLCKNCQYWNSPANSLYKVFESHASYGTCELADGGTFATHPESLAIAQDMERYAAELRTSPEFGCIQFVTRGEEK